MSNPTGFPATFLEEGKHYAEATIRKLGHVPVTLILECGNDIHVYPFLRYKSEDDRHFVIKVSKLLILANDAGACLMVLEAWVTIRTPEQMDPNEKPSESIDRQEAVVLVGESRHGNIERTYPIIRHDNRQFFGLGDHLPYDHPSAGDTFHKLMPHPTTPSMWKEFAKASLKELGITTKPIYPRKK